MSKKNASQATNGRGFSEGMIAVERDFPFYHIDSSLNLKGDLVDCVAMSPQKIKNADGSVTMKPWKALVFIATAATEARTREGEIVDVLPGDYVGVGMAKDLEALESIALHPTEVYEIELFAKEKINLGGGRTFRPFSYARAPQTKSRTVPVLGASAPVTVAALPAAQVSAN